jgi:hypothetical protein
MTEETAKLPEESLKPDPQTELLLGTIDALFGLGLALVDAKVVTPEHIARAMAGILAEQSSREATRSSSRQAAAKSLHRYFLTRIAAKTKRSRFGVIEGGKPEAEVEAGS